MATLQVDSLAFTFLPSVAAYKHDDSQHYRTVCQPRLSQTSVDIVVMRMTAIPESVWLIEAKDFRVLTGVPKPSNIRGLAHTIARNAIDTLRCLEHADLNAVDSEERRHATRALAARRRRVVLHLEPYAGSHSKLFPINFSGAVLQKLRQLVKGIDPHPLVLSIATTSSAKVPWTTA